MNQTFLILIAVVGGGAGLAIVGVALWLMRQEDAAARNQAAPGPASNSADRAAPEVPPAADSGPAEAGSAAEGPSLAGEPASPDPAPPPAAESPAPVQPARVAGWLNSLAGRVAAGGSQPGLPNQELLKLLRTPEGDLVVEVYGRRYRSRIEIADAPIEQQIANASRDLQAFLSAELPQPLKAAPPAALPPLPGPAGASKDPGDSRTVVKVTLEEAAQMEMKPPSMDIMRQWRYVRDQQRKPQMQIKSVMDEIDEILQVMLIGTPMAGRGLKATDGAHGAVFTFDGRNYDSVDALPDPEARELLRTAIQKWDQKR
jgi:type IV secretory pathway VirB10-like protein